MNSLIARVSGALLVVGTLFASGIAHAEDKAEKEANLEKTFKLFGPFKLSVGQVDSNIGVGLNGSYDDVLTFFESLSTDPAKKNYPFTDVTTGAMLSLSVDGAWRSGSENHSYGTLIFQPQFFQMFVGKKAPKNPGPFIPPDSCQKESMENPKSECLPSADYLEGRAPIFGYSLYPDLQYRVGNIEQGGKTYNANQTIYGGGVRLFYPATIGQFWAASPYVSASYVGINSSEDNDLPVPDDVHDKYLTVDGQVAVYVPFTEKLSCHAWTAQAKLTGSHPTSGGGGWEVARSYELLMQVGTSLKPALTYKTGTDKGLDYDRQLLLGVVWSFLDPSRDSDSSCAK